MLNHNCDTFNQMHMHSDVCVEWLKFGMFEQTRTSFKIMANVKICNTSIYISTLNTPLVPLDKESLY